MVAHRGDHLFLVVNAARKAADIAHLRAHLPEDVTVEPVEDRLLLALQGPAAEDALVPFAPAVREMRFMDVGIFPSDFGELWISRSGYTGEDGFEISVPAAEGRALAEALLAQPGVAPIGLGARDSLRLEAGLCLYGADLDETTSPAEAALGWAIQKARRTGGARAGGFPGADRILMELDEGPRACAWASCPRAARRCGRGRSFSPTRSAARPWARDLGRLRPLDRSAHVDGLCRRRPRRPRHAAFRRGARQAPARHRHGPHPSTPPPTSAEEGPMKFTEEHEWLMVDGDLVVVGITEFAAPSWATSSSSNCPRSRPRSPAATRSA
jgi:hypothetical protein